ncbi:hypothetical protein [Egicoccus sp. AB-alg2]|uniref:hypothetical protein n=1 Tax=Egicoccus sp. AB-alg2 TaxID=3242693 RepID=UPI00359DC6A4
MSGLLAALVTCSCTVTPEDRPDQPGATPDGRDLFVETQGDDAGSGNEDEPWRTVGHALQELAAGDRLTIGGGVYRERLIDVPMPDADEGAPTVVRGAPGEQPVIQGLLWLEGGSNWVLEGLDVTWDEQTGAPHEHMVKVTDGVGWTVRGAEISGARSYAGMLVAGTGDGEPAAWEVSGNCIRDTAPTNGVNQDHNLYVNTGLSAGPGRIEGNLLFGAPNGENLKLGPPGQEGGAVDVTVRNNTLFRAAQNLLVSGASSDNLIERNIFGGTGGGVGSIRSFELTGSGNVARDNIGFAAATLLDVPDTAEEGAGLADGGANRFPIDPGFDRVDSCDGFIPSNPEAAGYGHTGWEDGPEE